MNLIMKTDKQGMIDTIIKRIENALAKDRVDIHEINGVRGVFINTIPNIEYWHRGCEEVDKLNNILSTFDYNRQNGGDLIYKMALAIALTEVKELNGRVK